LRKIVRATKCSYRAAMELHPLYGTPYWQSSETATPEIVILNRVAGNLRENRLGLVGLGSGRPDMVQAGAGGCETDRQPFTPPMVKPDVMWRRNM
jgi:hypothetical protein